MIGFERPWAWIGLLPWAVFCLWLGWTQATALAEARRRVAKRFLARVSRYSDRSLAAHLLVLSAVGALLVAAVAGPFSGQREAPPSGGRRVLLLVDASASMYASDVASPGAGEPAVEISRFEAARALGRQVVAGLADARFAIVSFSGTATFNLPLTADRELVTRALETLEGHNYYQSTGSSLARALETAFHFTEEAPEGLSVVLLGDGELPFEESYAEPLAGLAELGVRVHAVAIGSVEGQARVIYDFRDVVARETRKRALVRYTTRRVDRHYQEIARTTGGSFRVAGPGASEGLLAALRAGGPATPDRQRGRRDLAAWALALATAGFLAHLLLLAPPRRLPGFELDLERLGDPPARRRATAAGVWLLAVVALLVPACAEGPRRRAHRANERGLVLDDLGRHAEARRQFELSAAVGFRPEVPIHNLARSLARREQFTEAHRLFQRALELAPELVDARFNDGVTLYEWGRAERDPRDCRLQRTLELWRGARRRFASIRGGVVELDEPAARAARNLERLDVEIAALEELIAEPPPHCAAAGGAAGGGEEPSGGGGGTGGAGEPPAAGPPPSAPGAPPPAGEGPGEGPLSEDERQRIESELERIARQAAGEGRFFRRTPEEQFTREGWSRPEAVIWW